MGGITQKGCSCWPRGPGTKERPSRDCRVGFQEKKVRFNALQNTAIVVDCTHHKAKKEIVDKARMDFPMREGNCKAQ